MNGYSDNWALVKLTVDTDFIPDVHGRPGLQRVLFVVFLFLSVTGTGVIHAAASCTGSSGVAAVTACQNELTRKPNDIDLRIRYADVLMDERQYNEAVNVLKKGLAMYPGSTALKRKYRLASSLAEEQKAIGGLPKTPAAGTSRNVNVIVCKTLKGKRALAACNDVLKTDPENVMALTRRGDELMAINQTMNAVNTYQQAVDLEPANAVLKSKLRMAKAKMPAKRPTDVVGSQPPVKSTPPKKKINGSQPKPRVPKAEISVVAVVKRDEPKAPQQPNIEILPYETASATTVARTAGPEVIQRYSNAPLSSGVTF